MKERLAAIATHPVQYHAPVYREVQRLGLPVTIIYGSNFSVVGYRDAEFGATFAWDTDLLSGYTSIFLSRAESGQEMVPETLRIRVMDTALDEIDPTAILLTGYGLRFYRSAWRSARRRVCPLLLRAETTDHAVNRSRWKAASRDAWLRRRYTSLSVALYIGQRSRQHYERLGVSQDRLTFSPYCVDVVPFALSEEDRTAVRAQTGAALHIPAEQIVLLYSGKLSDRKGVDLIPEAVSKLPSNLRERITFLWLGDGVLRESLATWSEALGVDVRFAGFQPQRALSAYYHAADVLVLPSRRGETWGLVVNEALHHGLPCVITSAVGCAPDLIQPGETGEVVAPDSSDALANGLRQLIAWWHDAPVIRARCRRQVADYSVDQAALGIIKGYEHAMRIQHEYVA